MGSILSTPADLILPVGTAVVATCLAYSFFLHQYRRKRVMEKNADNDAASTSTDRGRAGSDANETANAVETAGGESTAAAESCEPSGERGCADEGQQSDAPEGGQDTKVEEACRDDAGDGESQGLMVRVGISETIGKRTSMEDAWLQENITIGGTELKLFGVFDGHGGSEASAFCKATIPRLLAAKENFLDDPVTAIADMVEELEEAWLAQAKEEPQKHDGSTLLLGVLHGSTLYTANAGDSEGLVARNKEPVVLTYLHNPSKNPDEVARIEAEGGRTWRNRLAHPHLNPQFFNLGVSGAIGDLMYKDEEYTSGKASGIAVRPYVSTQQLGEQDDFVVLACDGLWDVFSYEVRVARSCHYDSSNASYCG
eukprot:TRINITY_DN2921_c0_g1_i2.p1 TRINITY_DN2921_c0_g1~~TRINITY_DN2921_c0_g1_i2.p1  ORF type:complete len:369 (+),score=91.80 TRINITY_DN2921_c0_g1_i2:101-1207(+)